MVLEDQDKNDSPKEKESLLSFYFNRFTHLCDENIHIIRYSGLIVGAVGLIVLARNVHLTRQFVSVDDIPKRFIDKNVRLNGIVKKIDEDFLLRMRHEPIYKLGRIQDSANLPVTLAGVQLCDEGSDWLRRNLVDQSVWFRLLQRRELSVDCVVHIRKNVLSNLCVNEALIRNGLAYVNVPENVELSGKYVEFAFKLQKLEAKAERKGLGIWKKPSLKERLDQRRKEWMDSHLKKPNWVERLSTSYRNLINRFKK